MLGKEERPPPAGELLGLLRERRDALWPELLHAIRAAGGFEELVALASMRKRAVVRGVPFPPGWRASTPLRFAIVGGATLHPLADLVELALWAEGYDAELLLGEFDNYTSEILDRESALHRFAPQVVAIVPSEARCRYEGALTDDRQAQEAAVRTSAAQLLDLCRVLHEGTRAEILLANFFPPPGFDLGAMRAKTLGSGWAFRRAVNLELGLASPPFVQICDFELLAARRGLLASRDARRWFESKQPCSPDLMPDIARELAHLTAQIRRSPKKVLVLDLDNTLWGGVLGDDGVEGIEIGDTSPRGEAFKDFQRFIAGLKERGVLLAVASKNDHARVIEALEKHPEMVLRPADFVSVKASWGPKSESILQMAAELELGLDSFVFVDDNPAEIEIVRQFAPDVTTILLGPDPSDYRATLEDCRLFEPRALTREDAQRTAQYQREAERRAELGSVTDMDAYLASLEMVARVVPFRQADVPRIAQLINKSNQFNLTTRRRSEGEVAALLESAEHDGFTIRLRDRFGDHGLIAVVVLHTQGAITDVDTWLMSCRVLKRQVEEETVNEIVRLAQLRGAKRVRGVYLPTKKNDMVRDLFERMGFALVGEEAGRRDFELDPRSFSTRPSHMQITRTA